MTNKGELNDINRKIFIINLIGTPGAILIGLSLYTIFKSNGDAIHPALNNINLVYSMLVLGIIIEIWQLIKLIPIFKKRAKLAKQKK